VVNDLPGVSDLAATLLTTRGLGDRVEFRPGDYLTIPVEDEAFDIVVLGHVLRAEDEARGRALVARALTALRPGGQVVVADYFADDERKRHPFGVQMGLTMLANTARGGMRTHGQVAGWLSTAGFERIRLLEPIGFNHVFVASRPPHPRPESRQEPQP
jgi:SAM-dependent methyltransferase